MGSYLPAIGQGRVDCGGFAYQLRAPKSGREMITCLLHLQRKLKMGLWKGKYASRLKSDIDLRRIILLFYLLVTIRLPCQLEYISRP
jgi:hypothetical protein